MSKKENILKMTFTSEYGETLTLKKESIEPIELLDDYLDFFLSFLHAAGFSYVENLTAERSEFPELENLKKASKKSKKVS